MDWLPTIDPWILAILIAGILLPELIRLVSSEIGARTRLREAATAPSSHLAFIALYIGARALLHSGSIASLEPHSYHGESARGVGAFPDALSILTWHGVVETQFASLHRRGPGWSRTKSFDPESADMPPQARSVAGTGRRAKNRRREGVSRVLRPSRAPSSPKRKMAMKWSFVQCAMLPKTKSAIALPPAFSSIKIGNLQPATHLGQRHPPTLILPSITTSPAVIRCAVRFSRRISRDNP